jgi:hypothetical protein
VKRFVDRVALEHEVQRDRRLTRTEFDAWRDDDPLDAPVQPTEQGTPKGLGFIFRDDDGKPQRLLRRRPFRARGP